MGGGGRGKRDGVQRLEVGSRRIGVKTLRRTVEERRLTWELRYRVARELEWRSRRRTRWSI